MTIHPSRIVAPALLFGGGFVVAVSALAILLTKVLVDAGLPVRPSDMAVLDDLVALLPLIGGFAAVNVVAAVGLLLGKSWADVTALAASGVAIAIGAVGLLLITLGRDPFASTVSSRSTADGLGMVGLFTLVYLVVFVAVGIANRPRPRRAPMGAAA